MEQIKITEENQENIKAFSSLLNKNESTIVNEALELYFLEETEKLKEKENSQTNLSFEEFWDDVDI